MENWKVFLDSLDSPGGHVLVLLILVLSFVAMAAYAPRDWLLRAVDMALAAFFTALVGKVRNGPVSGP